MCDCYNLYYYEMYYQYSILKWLKVFLIIIKHFGDIRTWLALEIKKTKEACWP